MPNLASAHAALDVATAAAFTGYTVIYKNQTAPKLVIDFIKQVVVFTKNAQFELGNSNDGRQYGKLLFLFHVRKGSGSSVLNTWMQTVISTFRAKTVGGVVLQNVLSLPPAETETWSITVLEIPFYFDG